MRGIFKRYNKSLGRDTWGCRYMTPSGRRRREMGFHRRKDAEDRLLLRKHELRTGTYIDPEEAGAAEKAKQDAERVAAASFKSLRPLFLAGYRYKRQDGKHSAYYQERTARLAAHFGDRPVEQL